MRDHKASVLKSGFIINANGWDPGAEESYACPGFHTGVSKVNVSQQTLRGTRLQPSEPGSRGDMYTV